MATSITKPCPACGRENRIPVKHLADSGKCGACKAVLRPSDAPIAADAETFDAVIGECPAPVLVDFWAAWCGPCKRVAPEVDALAREMAGRAVVLKVDTEQQRELAARYAIQSIPTFLVFRNGRIALRQSGAVSRREMRSWVDQVAAA